MKTRMLTFALFATLAAVPAAVAGDEAMEAPPPKEKFEDPVRNFQQAKEELLRNYVRDDLTEADLYRAAVQGMLMRVDPSLKAYNELLGPADFAELQISMKGQLVGIGVQLRFESSTGIAEVVGVVAGSPAERADVRMGDQILAVNGTSFRGKHHRELVDAIRGREGDAVQLETLRGAQVVSKSIRRERVPVKAVRHQRFAGDVEVLAISSFGEQTPADLSKALAEIQASGAKALVIDLRANSGGLLEQALESAKMLVPRGSAVAKLVHRGNRVDTVVADKEPPLKPLPTAVLINGDTMSSGELLAAALRQGLRAPLIGAKTKGKWSVQSIKELPNHYVMKYTVAMFQTPDGQSYEGAGLPPDIEVPLEQAVFERTEFVKDPEARLKGDVQLRAAVNLLRMRP